MKTILLSALLALMPLGVFAEQKEVVLSDSDWKPRSSTDPRQAGVALKNRTISLNTGAITYGLSVLTGATADGKSVAPVEGYLGMPQPTSENWYGGGFLAISVNGRDIGADPLKGVHIIETGERGACDVIWDGPDAAVRVRFLALPADDRLFCEIGLEPKTEIRSVALRTSCYPSFFTSWHKQKGHRVVESPASKVEEGTKFSLDPQKDWALVFYDTVFDFAAGRGAGPCGLLFLPEQIASGRITVGDYAVPGDFVVHPQVRNIRLIFWDFKGKSNKDVLAHVKGKAEAFREELRVMSFVNRTLAAFDFAAKKAETDAAVKSAKGTEDFAKQIAAIDSKLGPLCAKVREVTQSGQAIPFHLEAEAMQLIAEREQVQWKLKFHVLLND